MSFRIKVSEDAAKAIIEVVVDALPNIISRSIRDGYIPSWVMEVLCNELGEVIHDYVEIAVENP